MGLMEGRLGIHDSIRMTEPLKPQKSEKVQTKDDSKLAKSFSIIEKTVQKAEILKDQLFVSGDKSKYKNSTYQIDIDTYKSDGEHSSGRSLSQSEYDKLAASLKSNLREPNIEITPIYNAPDIVLPSNPPQYKYSLSNPKQIVGIRIKDTKLAKEADTYRKAENKKLPDYSKDFTHREFPKTHKDLSSEDFSIMRDFK